MDSPSNALPKKCLGGPKRKPCQYCGLEECNCCRCKGFEGCYNGLSPLHNPGEKCPNQKYGRRLVCNACERHKLKGGHGHVKPSVSVSTDNYSDFDSDTPGSEYSTLNSRKSTTPKSSSPKVITHRMSISPRQVKSTTFSSTEDKSSSFTSPDSCKTLLVNPFLLSTSKSGGSSNSLPFPSLSFPVTNSTSSKNSSPPTYYDTDLSHFELNDSLDTLPSSLFDELIISEPIITDPKNLPDVSDAELAQFLQDSFSVDKAPYPDTNNSEKVENKEKEIASNFRDMKINTSLLPTTNNIGSGSPSLRKRGLNEVSSYSRNEILHVCWLDDKVELCQMPFNSSFDLLSYVRSYIDSNFKDTLRDVTFGIYSISLRKSIEANQESILKIKDFMITDFGGHQKIIIKNDSLITPASPGSPGSSKRFRSLA